MTGERDEYGVVGLGRMGGNLARQALERGIRVVGHTLEGAPPDIAGELGLPYALVGFPVNYTTGVAEPGPKEELDGLLALSAKVLPELVLRAAETIEEEDLGFDHG